MPDETSISIWGRVRRNHRYLLKRLSLGVSFLWAMMQGTKVDQDGESHVGFQTGQGDVPTELGLWTNGMRMSLDIALGGFKRLAGE
jgi:hypothetical protein